MEADRFTIIGYIEEVALVPAEVEHLRRLFDLSARTGTDYDPTQSNYLAVFRVANQPYNSKVRLKEYDPSWSEPVLAEFSENNDIWLFRDRVVRAAPSIVPLDELKLRIKYFVAQYVQDIERMKRELEVLEKLGAVPEARHERINESVRVFVWRRDEGKCVQCGSRDKLEFDHIIPVVEGGSSSERNIQLLCESCNRAKGRKI